MFYPWNNKGVALSVLGRHEDAIRCYHKAIEIESGYATAWKNKGMALKALGLDDEADLAINNARELGLYIIIV
jgi:Flp pilus assembly protein TadD